MKLVSTTMTGNNEDVIGDAIASVVDWVDAVVVVDTGVTDRSLVIAREVAREKYVERKFPWVDDFAAARNFALEAAHEAGGDWAVMVDTDETIDRCGEDVRQALETAKVPHFMIFHESRIYVQPRFFRLPIVARFDGPTHEAYPAAAHGYETFQRCVFRDKPKSEAQLKAKFERDVRVLRAHTAKHPNDPRWFYYLGDALQNLGQRREAIEAFDACAALRGWNEESAWACYRAAESWCVLGDLVRAVDACAAGLARHSGIAELAWLAAFASYRAGKMHDAVWWARSSIALGYFRGCGAQVHRISFRNPMALWEGPYDVLRFALRALGDTAGADEAERLFAEASAARAAAR
jgi:tetratricopeptide (TPR) repeat protein